MDLETGLGAELQRRLKGNLLLIGTGNTLRGDDGAGPALIELLQGEVRAGLLDAGEIPESYLGRILGANAETIVLIDAADFGGAAGDIAVLETEDLAGCSLSTHGLPLDLFFRYLKENSRADMFALGIQPAQIDFGASMTPEISASVEGLANLLKRIVGRE